MMAMKFDLNDKTKFVTMKGGKVYMVVSARLQWFRDDHPTGRVETEVVNLDPAIMKALVYDGEGRLLATGHGSANDKGNAVWSGRGIEKAETAAIGRALGAAGYGTQFAGDEFDDGDHLADSPQERRQNAPQQPQNAPQASGPVAVANPMADAFKAVVGLYDMMTDDDAKKAEFKADVKRLQEEGKLTAKSTAAEIIAAVRFDLLPKMEQVVAK